MRHLKHRHSNMPLSLVIVLVASIAFLYAAVGHGGASGYIALMVLLSNSPMFIKPTALLLNVVVSAISFLHFYRSGYFRKEVFLPFTILSVPMAFLGAKFPIGDDLFKILLSGCLIVSLGRLLLLREVDGTAEAKKIPLLPALAIGALIGLLSGMIGIGGGVLLSPVLILFRWATLKESAAVAALFIFVNSLSGLAGIWSGGIGFSSEMATFVLAATVGGAAGGKTGAGGNPVILKHFLALVIAVAVFKLLL